MYEAFPSAEENIRAHQPVYGRHILDVPLGASTASILAKRKRLKEAWEQKRNERIEMGDPRSVAYANAVLEIIEDAAKDINKVISTEKLSQRG